MKIRRPVIKKNEKAEKEIEFWLLREIILKKEPK